MLLTLDNGIDLKGVTLKDDFYAVVFLLYLALFFMSDSCNGLIKKLRCLTKNEFNINIYVLERSLVIFVYLRVDGFVADCAAHKQRVNHSSCK